MNPDLNRTFWYIIGRHYSPSQLHDMERWAQDQERKLLACNDAETRSSWGEWVAQGGSL